MELFSIENGQKKLRVNKINKDLDKYKNDPRFLKKLEEDIKSIEENGGFEAIFEALRRYDLYDTPTVELAVAQEPQAAYSALKEAKELAVAQEPQAAYGVPKEVNE